jgi:hypothetical protein
MNGVGRRWNLAAATHSQMFKIALPGPSALAIIERMDLDEGIDYSIVLAAV